jgi:hypothetical protein
VRRRTADRAASSDATGTDHLHRGVPTAERRRPTGVHVDADHGFDTPSPGNTGGAQVRPQRRHAGQTVRPSGPCEFGLLPGWHGDRRGALFDRDADNDLFADNEPGMQGVTVTLWLSNSVVLTTTTDATGAYTFTGVLPANGYQVRVINPDPTNFLLVTPAGGDNDLQTSVGDDADTAAFNVAPGATVSGLSDAAVRGRAYWVTGAGVGLDLTGERRARALATQTVGALPGVTVALIRATSTSWRAGC